jgi:thiamine-phosphate pyrophosphorylase
MPRDIKVSDSLARAQLARAAGRLKARAKSELPSLILMTDDERLPDPLAAARALPRGSMVVVRTKDHTKLERLSGALLRIARTRGLGVVVAGDPELASRLGADGFHLPETRVGEVAYWRARFPALLITASAHSLRTLLQAQSRPVDAVFLSPLFATRSHPGRASLVPVRANLIAGNARLPVYALGGIDARNAQLLNAFAGIAAIGALAV